MTDKQRKQAGLILGKSILKSKAKELEYLVRTAELEKRSEILPEGTKVKINLVNMQNHPDYSRLTEKYRNWVEGHADDLFTVKYDPKHLDNPVLVSLAEDKTYPKWLFWVGDLIEVKENDNDL
jgi:hypothetical protein